MAEWKREDPETFAVFIDYVVEYHVEMERRGAVMVEVA
jgi:hypothetical protein